MKVVSGIYWEKGMRLANQDSVTLQQLVTGQGRVVLAAVSDGIGGLKEGEVASGYILESIVHVFYEQLLPLIQKRRGRASLRRCILRCFDRINRELNMYAREKEIRLGATVTLLLVWKRQYMAVHIGDSRLYICRKHKLKQLTEDHSSDRGLMKCLGSFAFAPPDIHFGTVTGRRGFLLCTDGFYRRLDRKMAGEVLDAGEIDGAVQAEKRLKALGESVLRLKEQDNASAVYIKVW